VAELVALARAQPGKLTYGSAGVGTTQHLSGELFKTIAGIGIQQCPLPRHRRGDTGPISGGLTMVFSSPASALPLAREGKVPSKPGKPAKHRAAH
jgi:tripartite-type tricarboxylate transporter receptor subunit TctC